MVTPFPSKEVLDERGMDGCMNKERKGEREGICRNVAIIVR